MLRDRSRTRRGWRVHRALSDEIERYEYPWIDGENYVGRCLPVIRNFVKDDDLKRASNSEHMTFAGAVAEVTDRACIPIAFL
jgi:hypothetical protein